VRLVELRAVVRADRVQLPRATPEPIQELVDHERVNHQRPLPLRDHDTVAAALAVEDRQVVPRVERHDRVAALDRRLHDPGDDVHRLAGVAALSHGLVSRDAVDLGCALGDIDAGIDDRRHDLGVAATADVPDRVLHDPGRLGVRGRRLQVEREEPAVVPGHHRIPSEKPVSSTMSTGSVSRAM
jgi:hypothetical protein